jgi:hypothetical protein
MMMRTCFSICAAFCFLAALFHEIAGGPELLVPLSSSDLPKIVTGMLTLSWHNDVVLMLGIGILFACAVFEPENELMAFIATGMTLGLGINAYGMALLWDPVMWETPAPIVWTVMPVIGAVGLLSGRLSSRKARLDTSTHSAALKPG